LAKRVSGSLTGGNRSWEIARPSNGGGDGDDSFTLDVICISQSTVKKEIAKLWSAAFIDTDNFTIDYGLAREWECHLFAQV
jgi:hypothetical protein